MKEKKILVVTDNKYLCFEFKKIIEKLGINKQHIDFRYSYNNKDFISIKSELTEYKPINIKENVDEIILGYDIIFSLHCKQIFPTQLVNNVRCINIHPGLSPYNRGYFPQVFSIINKLPLGVTIHEMDEFLDHGDIIYQKAIEINSWETSESVYNRIIQIELDLIEKYFVDLIENNYYAKKMCEEGNVNYFKEFKDLCELDLDKEMTMREAIDYLRALTHGEYKNAYFIDKKGNKVYVNINLEVD